MFKSESSHIRQIGNRIAQSPENRIKQQLESEDGKFYVHLIVGSRGKSVRIKSGDPIPYLHPALYYIKDIYAVAG